MKAVVLSRADEITLLHGEIEGALRLSVEKAIRVGELLTEQKADLAHGEWLPWVKENLPFNHSTASRYMRLFQDRAALKSVTVTSLTDAYRAIGVLAEPEAKPEPPPKARAQVSKDAAAPAERQPEPLPDDRPHPAELMKQGRATPVLRPKALSEAQLPRANYVPEHHTVDDAIELMKRTARIIAEIRPLSGFTPEVRGRLEGAQELIQTAMLGRAVR